MNKYLEVALEKLERSRGDIRWEGEKEALLEEATLNVQFAIAHELGRIADALEEANEQNNAAFNRDLWSVDND